MSICLQPTDITPAGIATGLHYLRLQTYDKASDWEEHFHEGFASIHVSIIEGVRREVIDNDFKDGSTLYDTNTGEWRRDCPGVSPWAQIAGICNAFSDIGGLGQFWPDDPEYCRRAVECCFDVMAAYQLVPDDWQTGAAFSQKLKEYCEVHEIDAPLLRGVRRN